VPEATHSGSARCVAAHASGSIAVLAVFYWGLFVAPADRIEAARPSHVATVDTYRQLVERSTALVREGRDREAFEVLRQLSDSSPNDHVYARQLAGVAQRLGRLQDEAIYLERFASMSPTPIEACPRLGEVYWKQGLAAQSLQAYERCLAFDEEDSDAVFYAARAYEWAGRDTEAQRLYERGLTLSPEYLDMALGLARLELRKGLTARARTTAVGVLEQDGSNVDALLIAGLACQREGNRADARKYLERGVQLKETYADFHLALGILAEEDQQMDVAMQRYARALELDATNRDASIRKERLAARIHQ
jgi:tetratricopeptide (TPR) repeat protein